MTMTTPGMAAQYPFGSEPTTFDWPIFIERLNSIFTASWSEPTGRHQQWRNCVLIYLYQCNKWKTEECFKFH